MRRMNYLQAITATYLAANLCLQSGCLTEREGDFSGPELTEHPKLWEVSPLDHVSPIIVNTRDEDLE